MYTYIFMNTVTSRFPDSNESLFHFDPCVSVTANSCYGRSDVSGGVIGDR